MKTNTILVTGATGTIGQEVIKQLQAVHATVFAGSTKGFEVAGTAGKVVDFNDPAGLERTFQGIDTLFLLFPLVHNKLELARNAVSAAKKAGVKHIVRSSGAGADAASPVAIARLQGEIDQLIVESGIPFTLVRPSSFMQNFVNYYGGMVKAGTVYLSYGDGKSAFIDARDIAAVDAEILTHPEVHAGKIYTLTGAAALGVAEAVSLIGTVTGNPVEYVAVPESAAVDSMRKMGMDEWTIGIMSSLNQIVAAGYTAGTTSDVEHLLGRPPRTFASFAKDFESAWR